MLVHQALPAPRLQRWIHSFRQYRFTAGDTGFTCLPGTGGELWLPLGGRLDSAGRPLGAGLLCLRSRRIDLRQSGLRLFSIRFRAGALPFFVARPLAELIDRYTPLAALCNESSCRQWTGLQASPDFAEQCLLAERLLLALQHGSRQLEAMQELAGTIFEQSSSFRLGDYANRMRRDRSELSRQFHATQGTSAKHYHRLCRFERFLRNALCSGETTLAGLAVYHGYCDQAHLCRDVRQLTAQTPRTLLARGATRFFYTPRALR